MKKLLYWIRKLLSIIIFLLCVIFIMYLVYYILFKHEVRSEQVITAIVFIIIGLVFLGKVIYPYRTKYCSCGRKYSENSFEYVETKTIQGKEKEHKKTTYYQYKINIVCFCEHCNKEYKYNKDLNGGFVIEHLDDGTYEDKKVSYDQALQEFKNSKNNKK